jgi:2-dehydro-3-deoxyphosphogluconate aldolase/(4S)-4-hydroxy-2-oxoglutarate aldolase
MNKAEVRRRILEVGIVPVVRASSVRHALAAAEAVASGGIPVVEITMTVPNALEAISTLAKQSGDKILVGAGTVLDADNAQRCVDAGARFLVSPGLDFGTLEFATTTGTLIMAGALTPTEIMHAWKNGADFVKVFPASAMGGASYLKALRGPLPQVPLVPTGGVNLKTAGDFLNAGASALGVGSELVSAAALESGDLAQISSLAKQYVEIVRETRQAQRKPAAVAS